jgi:uncharacterized protein YjlB
MQYLKHLYFIVVIMDARKRSILKAMKTNVVNVYHNSPFVKITSLGKLNPELFYFRDDGEIPNSNLPLLIYRRVSKRYGPDLADWMEAVFSRNGWKNIWRWGIHPYHHYHSNTHEVLGVFSGQAMLMIGGTKGKALSVGPGDVLVVPAGVGHRCISYSNDFCVIGAYSNSRTPDLNKGLPEERPRADMQLANVPLPESDPLAGRLTGLCLFWAKSPISKLFNPLKVG